MFECDMTIDSSKRVIACNQEMLKAIFGFQKFEENKEENEKGRKSERQ